jgi:uncharacterized delta-60 repeat protein
MRTHHFTRKLILTASLAFQLGSLCWQSRPAAGDVDLTFNPGSGVNGEVKAMALQPDGKVLIGGAFTMVKGLVRFALARLNSDGSGDATFDAGTNADRFISAIAVQPDGKVIFTRDNSIPAGHKVARLKADGSLDTSFAPALETFPSRSAFTCMAVQPDGRIVLGGYSMEPDGFGSFYPRSLLIRLNADGAIDNTFMNADGTFDGPSGGSISSLALQADGRILIAGEIAASINGTNHYDLIRLHANGTVDTNFNSAEGIIKSVRLQTDGKILLAGYGIGNSTNWNAVVRLNANGSRDDGFLPGTDPNSSLIASAVQSNGKIICIGGYVYVSGTNRNGIVRLNSNGSVDAGFNATTGAPNNAPAVIALQPDDRILIGGGFTLVNGTNREHIARLNSDGSLDNNFNPGSSINAGVNSVALQADGKVIIGGNFTIAGGAARSRVARLNADGSLDGTFDPGAVVSSESYNPYIGSILAQADGKVFIGGSFTAVNGTNRKSLARLNPNGTLDSGFVPSIGSPGVEAVVVTLAVQANGKLLVGGASVDSVGNGLARLNGDGSFDTLFHADTIGNTGADYTVINSVAVRPDGKILAGGYFVKNDVPGFLLTRLNADGSRDTNFSQQISSIFVTCIVPQPDGKIVVGSAAYDGASGWVARLNSNGTVDGSFNPSSGNGSVQSVLLQPNGKILVAGDFSSLNGTNRTRIACLNSNGNLDMDFNPGTGADAIVRAIALQSDGHVVLAGDFTTINGVVRPHIARLYGNSLPSLNIARSNASMILSWSTNVLNFQLQESTNLSLANAWTPVGQARVTNSAQISVTILMGTGPKFFRLNSQ